MSTLCPPGSLGAVFSAAAGVVAAVLRGQSLADDLLGRVSPTERPAVQDMVYSTLRAYGRGRFYLAALLRSPIPHPEVEALLLLALARLETRPETAHTIVDQAVEAAGGFAQGRFRGLVNGVLRQFLRQQAVLQAEVSHSPEALHQHPGWWLSRLQADHPNDWPAIVEAGNQPPPMALRVNVRQTTSENYLAELTAAGIAGVCGGSSGIHLEKPVSVDRLPGFFSGQVSVQDPGAQQAAELLSPATGARVLDACAAPGGKTAHLLEKNDLDLWALDLKPARCRRITDNLNRLGLTATVKVADCIKRDTWWDGQAFDAILADVPCSASGVVRRHPDAKWLRCEADIARFAATQSRMLDALWVVLKPGGRMLYATCSVFAEENQQQIVRFLRRQPQARNVQQVQWLPAPTHDGFFYALLEKHA